MRSESTSNPPTALLLVFIKCFQDEFLVGIQNRMQQYTRMDGGCNKACINLACKQCRWLIEMCQYIRIMHMTTPMACYI